MSKIQEKISSHTPQQTGNMMLVSFPSQIGALLAAVMIKHQQDMYKGELNPRWKYWDDVVKHIQPEMTAAKETALFESFSTVALDY